MSEEVKNDIMNEEKEILSSLPQSKDLSSTTNHIVAVGEYTIGGRYVFVRDVDSQRALYSRGLYGQIIGAKRRDKPSFLHMDTLEGNVTETTRLELNEAFYLIRTNRLRLRTVERKDAATYWTASAKAYAYGIESKIVNASIRVLLLIGLPGSGKSTFASLLTTSNERYEDERRWVRASSDELGSFRRCFPVARWALNSGYNLVIDSCNPKRAMRSKLIDLVKKEGVDASEIACLWFQTDRKTCERRIRNRGHHPTLNASSIGAIDGDVKDCSVADHVSQVVASFEQSFDEPDAEREGVHAIYRFEGTTTNEESDDVDPTYDIETVSKKLDEKRCWSLFCGVLDDFPILYAVYVHFRRRGWIPRHGGGSGADMVLYEASLAKVHARFCVFVIRPESSAYSWSHMQGMNRVSAGQRKHSIICEVEIPKRRVVEGSETECEACERGVVQAIVLDRANLGLDELEFLELRDDGM